MFCSNCGAEARGNFCSECGESLVRGVATTHAEIENWQHEIDYAKLIRIPEVRDRIERYAAMAPKRLSGEEFLALCDKVVSLGVPLESVGAMGQALWARLGIETGKEHFETFSIPSGTAIVAALCALARGGQIVQQVRQFTDGCLLEAKLPSDIWSFEGRLMVNIRRREEVTRVEGATEIEGQLFDWGKSRRCLQALFRDIKEISAKETARSHL